MRHRNSSSESGSRGGAGGLHDTISNIRTKPPHIYDNITRKLLQLSITLSVTTFVGLIVRYAVQEFDPSVNTITVTTSRVNNRDVASLSVSKNFLERILEFIEESVAITGTIVPLGFPLCTLFNRYFARLRAGAQSSFDIKTNVVLNMIPKYVVIGDSQAVQLANSSSDETFSSSNNNNNNNNLTSSAISPASRLRPLVRDTIYHLIKARLKPKLITEDSYEEARRLGIRIGLIRRDHHRLAVIKSVDLLRNITDSRGDIKQGKVRYLLSRMKIMSQATPADKSLLIYLMKHCESMPNENLAYIGYTFTDPEAMRLADCALTFDDCDDDDVKKSAQVIIAKSPADHTPAAAPFTDVYLFVVVCLIASNIRQSYALYQISASVACCLYRFLSITVFQEQLISHSQFTLLIIIQQLFAIFALMTKWLSSLPQAPVKPAALTGLPELTSTTPSHQHHQQHHQPGKHRSTTSMSGGARGRSSSLESLAANVNGRHHEGAQVAIQMRPIHMKADDTLGSSSSLEGHLTGPEDDQDDEQAAGTEHSKSRQSSRGHYQSGDSLAAAGAAAARRRHSAGQRRRLHHSSESHIHLSGTDLDLAVINSKLATTYKQTFHNSSLIDDVTYRLAKLHVAYQVLVMIIIMIFGNAMFQLSINNNRQHQTLAFNSLMMNNLFSLASCFNQFGQFNLRSGLRNHPFFVCVLLLAAAIQVCLTELNAFGLENLNPLQWFVCFVFAFMSALIAPLTGQQRRQRAPTSATAAAAGHHTNHNHRHQQQQQQQQQQQYNPYLAAHQQHHHQHQAKHGHSQHHSRPAKAASPSKVHPKQHVKGATSASNISDNH